MHDVSEPSRADYGPLGSEGDVGLNERLTILGNRLLHSRAYNLLYALLIALNTVALLVALSLPTREPSALMVALDAAITGSLLVEVAIRMIVQGRHRFWSEGSNRFDCFVCGLCVMTLALYLLEGPSGVEKAEQVLTIVVVVVRYAIQIARLAVFVRSYKRTASGLESDIILEDTLDLDADGRVAHLDSGGLHGAEDFAHFRAGGYDSSTMLEP